MEKTSDEIIDALVFLGIAETVALNREQTRSLFRLLTKSTVPPEFQVADIRLTVDGAEVACSRKTWDRAVADLAAEATMEIDRLLTLYPLRKSAEILHWQNRKQKKRGRRRPEENYWLAREIADAISAVPGIKIVVSRSARPTVFMEVLRVSFEAIDHPFSLGRVAAAAAMPEKPTGVDDETWATYLTESRRGKGKRG